MRARPSAGLRRVALVAALASCGCGRSDEAGGSATGPATAEPDGPPMAELDGPAPTPTGSDPFAGVEALRPRARAAWPLENVDITGFDGWRIDPTHGGFTRDPGLSFASEAGAFVLAIADARVSAVERDEADQLQLRLDHGAGIESHYGPLSDALVHVGMPVDRGAALGLAAGTTLHLRVTIDGVDIDPLLIIRQPLHRWPALLRSY